MRVCFVTMVVLVCISYGLGLLGLIYLSLVLKVVYPSDIGERYDLIVFKLGFFIIFRLSALL